MLYFAGGVLATVVVAFLIERFGRPALHSIIGDVKAFANKLDDFVVRKEVEITDHLEEIALHKSHASFKGSERDRAARIRDRITELLQ